MKKFILLMILTVLFLGCKKENYQPKPFGYMRVKFPEHQYVKFDTTFPYSFEYPVYGKIQDDPEATDPYWINIQFPQFKATLHITYYPVHNNLDTMLEDSHMLVYKHTIKADNITAKDYVNDSLNVHATLFILEGNAATPYQFHITDSTKHFLRGSFYFNVRPSYDSLYPFINFFKDDIMHFIETFKWK